MTALFAALAFMIAAQSAEAPSAAPLTCERPAGQTQRPLVPDAETARAIFLAVEKTMFPDAKWASDDIVAVVDGDDRWIVMRTKDEAPPGTRIVGGGGLSFEIRKCDGAMSRPAFMR